jgi:microcystin-dependent protein
MPRDGSGVYNVPSGTYGVEDTSIESARYNAFVDDVASDLNHPRPIVAGGTGATNAADALAAMGGESAKQVIANYNSDVMLPGSFYSAASATGAPVTGHRFAGMIYVSDTNNLFIEARDQDETTQPGRVYIRQKNAGVWSSWNVEGVVTAGTAVGIGSPGGDMFYGIRGTAPNSQFVVNSKADASGTDMLTVSKTGVMTGDGFVHPGLIMDFGGTAAPAGWLACDGQSLPVGAAGSTYYALWQAIGYTWGGSGANFNVPNLQTRFRRHRDGNAAFAGAVGTFKGPANLAHTHAVSGTTGTESANHTHDMSHTTGTESANHTHNIPVFANNGVGGGSTFVVYTACAINSTGGSAPNNFVSGSESAAHTHSFSGSTGAVSALHNHTFSVTSGTGSADDSNEARPYSATVLTCIKV